MSVRTTTGRSGPPAAVPIGRVVRLIVDRATARDGGRADVHLCRAGTAARAGRDPALRDALARGWLTVAAGRTYAVLGPLLGGGPGGVGSARSLPVRVAATGGPALRHYLLTPTWDAAREADRLLRTAATGATVAGAEGPGAVGPTPLALDHLAHRIRTAAADVVWVDLGPDDRQHAVAAALATRVSAVVVTAGGALAPAAAAVAGREAAPGWVRANGLAAPYAAVRSARDRSARALAGAAHLTRGSLPRAGRPALDRGR